ncbi:hypothetical protein DFH07DRAFT_908919 [Mycena maculata]|uniref:Peroxisomal membrane protein PEX14 n=1 Tax=Mycena maculata TaxID=230809 RepID=A0AAD7KF40_9AGAR|nr:hypothetical protein DFH07DRAFT_908919 [Mycena maculata]
MASSPQPDRQELIRNAVVFLNDPNASESLPAPSNSPLAQRIQFLEAKGLTPVEIDFAVRQAAQGSSYAPAYAPSGYPLMAPPPYRWDWRDYFITAVVSGTVTYGAVALFKKYLLPHLKPPTSTAYEDDRDALTAQFDAAEALLKEIQAESAAVRAAVEAQKEQIDQTTKNVDAMVQEVRDGEAKTRDEMREIRDEVNSIREMLPKMIERNKDSQTQSLAELQHELKSLKALLLSRGPTIPSGSLPSSPLPVPGRPSIPAWQLAGASPATPERSEVPAKYILTATDSAPSPAMFSQFVQNLSPHARSESAPEARPASPSSSRSLDGHASTASTGQLAESALANLRKSLAHQRPASPGAKSPPPRAHKSTLEDRLRATFTIGEASTESTPVASSRVSPVPPPVENHENHAEATEMEQPMSPSHIPLPDSRVSSPILMHEPTAVLAAPPPPSEPIAPASPKPQPPEENSRVTDVDALQERLKLVEQRFSDVSTSFKRLQAEKAAADVVLRELTPLETISDSQALRDFVQNVILKSEISLEEIARLNGKLGTQEDRIEELRDTHRLESGSQSAQIEKLKKQLAEVEALLAASQNSVAQGDECASAQKAEIERLLKEVEGSKRVAKEEEEKRVKAISLLKTVRQKLVKAEKERDDLQRDSAASKDKEKAERENEQLEKARLRAEIDTANSEREKAIAGLRAQFDRESTASRDRYEKEIGGLRGQFELEALTTKSAHSKEVGTLTSWISSLETTLAALANDKNAFFDQLQLRQAELESAQSHLDSLQSQNTELQYQLRESEERFTLLTDDITEARREQDSRSREPSSSAEDVARLLSAAEAKYESKLADLKKHLSVIEKERNESEAQWSRKLRDKVRENDDLKQVLGSATKTRELDEGLVEKLKDQIKLLQDELRLHQVEAAELRAQSATLEDAESSTKAQETETNAKIHALEHMVEEVKTREAQLRASNKTLREELRKVQSSAALLERQRNPGVGYWTSKSESAAPADIRTSLSSASSDSRLASPAPETPTSPKNEEEVNLEYLRNVILQFLEHKEMRPNLVKVLSIILHFTPQETRRLVAKV